MRISNKISYFLKEILSSSNKKIWGTIMKFWIFRKYSRNPNKILHFLKKFWAVLTKFLFFKEILSHSNEISHVLKKFWAILTKLCSLLKKFGGIKTSFAFFEEVLSISNEISHFLNFMKNSKDNRKNLRSLNEKLKKFQRILQEKFRKNCLKLRFRKKSSYFLSTFPKPVEILKKFPKISEKYFHEELLQYLWWDCDCRHSGVALPWWWWWWWWWRFFSMTLVCLLAGYAEFSLAGRSEVASRSVWLLPRLFSRYPGSSRVSLRRRGVWFAFVPAVSWRFSQAWR